MYNARCRKQFYSKKVHIKLLEVIERYENQLDQELLNVDAVAADIKKKQEKAYQRKLNENIASSRINMIKKEIEFDQIAKKKRRPKDEEKEAEKRERYLANMKDTIEQLQDKSDQDSKSTSVATSKYPVFNTDHYITPNLDGLQDSLIATYKRLVNEFNKLRKKQDANQALYHESEKAVAKLLAIQGVYPFRKKPSAQAVQDAANIQTQMTLMLEKDKWYIQAMNRLKEYMNHFKGISAELDIALKQVQLCNEREALLVDNLNNYQKKLFLLRNRKKIEAKEEAVDTGEDTPGYEMKYKLDGKAIESYAEDIYITLDDLENGRWNELARDLNYRQTESFSKHD